MERGVGVFARASVVDHKTNIANWTASVGLGGRGVFESRPEDRFGIGHAYTKYLKNLQLDAVLDREYANGVELFSGFRLGDGVDLTADLQLLEPASLNIDNTTALGLRLNIDF